VLKRVPIGLIPLDSQPGQGAKNAQPADDRIAGVDLIKNALDVRPVPTQPDAFLAMPKSMLRSEDQPLSERDEALIASALRTLETEAGGLTALSAAIANSLGRPFIAAVSMIRAARGRVIVSGMGKSGHIGRKIAATLSSTGTPAFFVHPAEASHGDLGMIASDDVIIAMSWSGETTELKNLIDYSRRFRIGLIAITADAASTLGQAADVTLMLPQAREACPHNLAPTTSSLMQLALGDALAIALLESRGFTALDFRDLHPGGRLGALLAFTRDLMHTGPQMPLKPVGAKMSDAIVEMSTKGFGCVGITDAAGRLIGIITDGDLRRHMRPDLLDARVEDVMTKGPTTVRPDQLASEALEILNSLKRTVLFVVEGERAVGLVHMHDLLRAGVA
jgi:arabinose-5-phosphate isomerase